MKKKVLKGRLSSKKKVVTKKKSYYKPKKKVATKKKVVKKKVAKKSYYKPKKKIVEKKDLGSAYIAPLNRKEVDITAINVPVHAPVAVVQDKIDNPTKSKRPVKYLNNRDLLAQVLLSKKKGGMSDELAKMLMLLTSRYAKKGNFANYTYNDDMQSYAMMMLVKTWASFDPARSSNPFAFYTQCIKSSFIQYLNYEKRQRDVKDSILVDQGLSPSFGFQYDYEERQGDDHEPETVEAALKPSVSVDTYDRMSESSSEEGTPTE